MYANLTINCTHVTKSHHVTELALLVFPFMWNNDMVCDALTGYIALLMCKNIYVKYFLY